MKSDEAAATLDALDETKSGILNSYRPPWAIILFSGLSGGLVVFGYGMTEHENMWALAMWVGAFGFILSAALNHYTLRILGIKLRLFPSTKAALKFGLVQALVLMLIFIVGRQVRLAGFEYAPHFAALIGGVWFAYLMYKYPTGERSD